ncbi:hypothetical protein AAIB33_16015 [Microbacterium sp. AZCO]|uniref:hypothetical protein n=1 Tax=Microbacterium sp. AZCO TaxID=3142976 RepID=UPI0031F42C2E
MRLHRLLPAATVALAAGLALAACSSPSEAEPEYDVIDVGSAPAEATAPGTTLKIGETAWILDEDSGQLVGTTVREVRELDPDAIEGFADNDDFAGYTPYAVVTQSDADQVSPIDVLPIDEAGETTSWMGSTIGNAAMGDADACGIALPESTSTVSLQCFVALSKTGPVVGAVYNGSERDDFFADSDHPFAATPITWR